MDCKRWGSFFPKGLGIKKTVSTDNRYLITCQFNCVLVRNIKPISLTLQRPKKTKMSTLDLFVTRGCLFTRAPLINN